MGTVGEVIVQHDHAGHETKAAIVQWGAQDDWDNEGLLYPEARLGVCPRARKVKKQQQLVREHKVRGCHQGGRM